MLKKSIGIGRTWKYIDCSGLYIKSLYTYWSVTKLMTSQTLSLTNVTELDGGILRKYRKVLDSNELPDKRRSLPVAITLHADEVTRKLFQELSV